MKAVKFSVAAAAALALSTAAMATPTVYGQINAELGNYAENSDSSALGTRSWGSRLGVKGSKDLGDGLTALYQVEAGINAVTNAENKYNHPTAGEVALGDKTGGGNGDNALSSRNTFVGVSGGFGTVLIGNHDTPYKIAARGVGTVTHTDAVDTLTLTDRRLKSAVAYIAPIEGMTVAAAIVPVRDADRTRENDGMHMSLGFLMPVSEELKVAAGYESAYAPALDVAVTEMFVAANFKMGNMTIGAAVETEAADGDAVFTRIMIPFTMKMDGGMFVNAAVRNTTYDDAFGGETEMAIGASVGKMYGKDFEVYAGLNSYTAKGGTDGNDVSDVAVGMRVYF